MTLQASVSIHWVNNVLQTAARLGVPEGRLLAVAGIDPAERSEPRWPIDHITRLWRAAASCTRDPGFGLKAGSQVGSEHFSGLAELLQTTASLREAIGLVQRYQRLVSDGGRVQMISGDGASWLVYHPRQGALAFSPQQIEAVLAAVLSLARWICGQPQLQPLRVQFNQPRLGPLAGYRQVFGITPGFEQAFSGLLLDNHWLDQPRPQADRLLADLHHRQAEQRLAQLGQPGALLDELRRWLQLQLDGQLPQRAQAAAALGLSERSLARQLQRQGSSFSALLDDNRRQRALAALDGGDESLAQISQRLGFAEPSVFCRAFQRWTGQSPGQWRRQQASEAGDDRTGR